MTSALRVGLFWTLTCLTAATTASAAQDQAQGDATRSFDTWPRDVIDTLGALPIQDRGRVKPLSTYARFKLYQFNAQRALGLPAFRELGQRDQMLFRMRLYRPDEQLTLKPMEWLLDCLFYPRQANTYECFLIETWDVLNAIGVSTEGKKKRDRYSYDQLRTGRAELSKLGSKYQEIADVDPKKLTKLENQILGLAHNIVEYEYLTHFLDFARFPFSPTADTGLARVFQGQGDLRLSALLEAMPKVLEHVFELQNGEGGVDGIPDAEKDAYRQLLDHLDLTASSARALSFIPPASAEEDTWLNPALVAKTSFDRQLAPDDNTLRLIAAFERAYDAKSDPGELARQLEPLRASVAEAADQRGEYAMVAREISYYRKNLLFWSLFAFIASFVFVTLGWISFGFTGADAAGGAAGKGASFLRGSSRLVWKIATFFSVVAIVCLVYAITERCIIRSRPPVSTLYETVLFFAACASLLGLGIELFTRVRIGLSLTPFLGALGLFLAGKYEVSDGNDTMPQLVAVLDTNYYLTIHVLTVTFGYVAGLVAAFAGTIYLVTKMVMVLLHKSELPSSKAALRIISRITYGIIAFGLIFSTFGTIYGGVWANDSWGRFWGWDPKENGALLIILWELAIVHGRMGGYIRDHGLCMAAVFGGMIVAFSWWHVNLLGVGLHSYGFTEGIMDSLKTYYWIQLIILGIGAVAWLMHYAAKNARRPPGGPTVEAPDPAS